ncbi:uncharacterized protein [Lepeophtheirus salmonis]|uniref:uncharacterized protein n=1 Tax=Lepeophtheirus salmonis TaxID=72036 RepID=UPI001AE594E0|nr:DNA translocase FtsK-like [Lepeophtheirus salmonis]
MNRLIPIILVLSTTTSFIVESQRNFLDLLESIQSNTTNTTTTTETPESSSKTYPKQRSRARFEVREKYQTLLAELENSVNDEYYENLEDLNDGSGEGSGEDDYYYYFDYEEVPKSEVPEENKFPELSRLLSNTDKFFEADERFKSGDDTIKKKKRRVKRSALGFPKHHHMDHIGYRPPHYMEGVDFTLETVFGLPMADYYISRYGVHTPMDSMPNHGHSAPKTSYSVEPTYHEPEPKYKEPEYHAPIKPEYHEPIKPEYHEPIKPEYHAPIKPVYHEPVKPEYHPPEPVYKTPDYHEPPKLDYIIPKKPQYNVPAYHDPQLDYNVPKKAGIVLPIKKKLSAYDEEYYNVKPKYQTPIYYSSSSPQSPRPQFFKPKKALPRPPKFSSAEENGYAVYYLPYDQYVLEYPDYGLNQRVPTLPGNAHFLVASPHRPPSLVGRRNKRSIPVEGGLGHHKNPKL